MLGRLHRLASRAKWSQLSLGRCVVKGFRVLDASETASALPMDVCIEAMRVAFGDERVVPLRTRLGPSLIMPGSVRGGIGVKVLTPGPGGGAGVVVALDENGRPLGLLDGATISAIRTGAATGLATDLLADHEASTLAILGAGAMAFHQIEAIRLVRSIERVVVWSQSYENARKLAQSVDAEPIRTIPDAIRETEIIVTATPSKTALFEAIDVMPGVHINAIGSYRPDMAELPISLLREAYVVVDDYSAAEDGAGELIQAGVEPQAEISDLLAGRAVAPAGGATVFKSVGIASQDIAAALAALRLAGEAGLGIVV